MTAAEPVVAHQDRYPLPQPGAATDPVCGMSVDPASARHRAEHDGKSYFFCGTRCLERFSAEP
jgi:Cu+-exporting ATPase